MEILGEPQGSRVVLVMHRRGNISCKENIVPKILQYHFFLSYVCFSYHVRCLFELLGISRRTEVTGLDTK